MEHSIEEVGGVPTQATARLAFPPAEAELAEHLSLPEGAGAEDGSARGRWNAWVSDICAMQSIDQPLILSILAT